MANGSVVTAQLEMEKPGEDSLELPTDERRRLSSGAARRERLRQWRANRIKRCKTCLKQFFTFLFSQIGIFCLVIGYTLLGGIIFMEVESPFEKQEQVKMTSVRKRTILELWNATTKYNMLYKKNWTDETNLILRRFQEEVFVAIKERGWSGSDDENDSQWTFADSLLFAITIITTIGYGHITPKTTWGRILTMFYALPGIPLMFLCLTNIGNMLATTFRYLYVASRRLCVTLRDRNKSRHLAERHKTIAIRRLLRRKQQSQRPPAGRASDDTPTIVITNQETSAQHSAPLLGTDTSAAHMQIDPGELMREIESVQNEHARRAKHRSKNEQVSVPLTLSILLIVLYILAGALLFSLWERDNGWTFLIGSYFCFVTLTTIGFGDYVPGTKTDTAAAQEKLIFCALYMIFGLALICMCFNLMQEEVRNKFRWLGKKIGILDDDDEEDGSIGNGDE